MQIVGALDVHRRQITFKTLEPASGESWRGRISPAAREPLRQWLERFEGVEARVCARGDDWLAVRGRGDRACRPRCTSRRSGGDGRQAGPQAAREDRQQRLRADAGLLLAGELPEAWIPPVQILELRTRVRLRKTLIDQRTAWLQRLQAQLFHQGVPPGLKPRTAAGRQELASVELSPAGREAVELSLRMLDQLDRELAPIDRALQAFARRQPGCRALIGQLYGVGAVTATAILAELGDARRFGSSDDAVRHCGLDVTVWQSDRKRAAGHLSHQGPSVLRWALFEAAQCAARRSSPDHAYYLEVAKTDRPQPRLPLGRAQTLPARPPHPARTRRRRTRPTRPGERDSSSPPPPNHSPCACPSSDRCLAAGSRNAPAANAPGAGRPP